MATITLKEAANYFGKGGELAKKMRGAAQKGLLSAALRMKQQLVTREVPKAVPAPIDKGIYRAGWQVEKLPDGAAIYNAVPYAVFIEEGVSGANVVPSTKFQTALAEWVQRKLGGRRKAPSIEKARSTAEAVNKAKKTHQERVNRWRSRIAKLKAKNIKRQAENKPALPTPQAPKLKIPGGNGRLGGDYNYAWEVAGAIMHSMKKRGIFNRGRGLRIMEKYVRAFGPALVRGEVQRALDKELG